MRLAATETVAVESRKAWETKEDAGLREASAVAALLREEPCCPPSGKRERESFTDMSSGARLPAAHCAFKGCVFVSEKPACESWLQPAQYWSAAAGRWEQAKTWAGADCCGDSQCLWEHVLQQHGEVLHAERGKRLALSLYVAAIAERERRKMPHVGYSVDRRVLTHLSVMQRKAETKGLICALCAQICLQGAGRASQIGTATVAVVFEETPEAVFRENWCYKTYVDRYATCDPMANADCTRSWSWRRRIVGRRYDGREAVCCPEDEECDAKHSDTEWCLACRIPLCVKCRAHGSKRAIPAALSNDNLLGYPPAFLYSLKVRYIEAAAASPLFTACVSFYIENDYGHLLEEELHAAKNSVAVRGSITSLEMPWPAIMDQFLENVSRDPADYLPHSPEILARMVFLHLRVAHAKEVAEWLPCTRALMSSSGRERLLHRLRARVETLYPEEEQHLPLEQRQGRTPAVILERARVQEIGRGDSELLDKNATPGEAGTVVGSMEGSETWNGSMFTSSIRADVAGADRTRGARVEEQVREAQSLGKYQRFFVATNSKFVDQWQPRYVSHAFPFSLPRAVSGPDFPQRERDRRVSEAAQLSPKEFLRSLPARVEDSIRNDWNLVPAVRRVTSMWEVVCNNRVFVPAFKVGNISAAEQAERTVNAARSLYKRLTRGKWHDGKRLRPVKGDTSKLSLCKDLSTVEQHLVRNMRLRSQNLPGTQEVRRVIGQCLLGARIEFGPPLFITISPGTRHSGLVMRLSRYRQEDPAVEEEQRAWIGADTPSLWAGSEHVNVDLPTYKMRRNVTCRDPWSVTQAFTCSIRFLLSVLLGTRACEHCGLASKCHCVDTYGQSCQPLGGALALVSAWGGAVEYQKSGAPHFHGNVHIVSVYEKHSLVEIAALIEQAALDPATVIEYQEYIHRCLHFDESGHAAEQEALEAAWRDNYADPAHDRLGWWPGFLKSEDMKTTYAAAGTEEEEKKWKKEGKAFVESFQREAQYVHSRCQHHVHRMDPVSGQKRPLSTCTSRRCKDECKHGFPAEKQVTARCKVICQGNARKHGYRVRGRRSQLGCILAKRKNPWLSGTAPVFCTCISVQHLHRTELSVAVGGTNA